MELKEIGVIHTPFRCPEEAPAQGRRSSCRGKVEIYPDYAAGLEGLSAGQYVYLLYFCHRAARDVLYSEKRGRGVFATRSPRRPNPIALVLVKILDIRGNVLVVEGLDAIDGSPLLDIKPFVRDIDCV